MFLLFFFFSLYFDLKISIDRLCLAVLEILHFIIVSTLGLEAAAYFPNKHNLGYPESIFFILHKVI